MLEINTPFLTLKLSLLTLSSMKPNARAVVLCLYHKRPFLRLPPFPTLAVLLTPSVNLKIHLKTKISSLILMAGFATRYCRPIFTVTGAGYFGTLNVPAAGDCWSVSSLPLVRFERVAEASNKANLCQKRKREKAGRSRHVVPAADGVVTGFVGEQQQVLKTRC
jgi:hypothetical protein